MDNPKKTMELYYYLFHSETYGIKPKFIKTNLLKN